MSRSIPVLCYHAIDGSGRMDGALGHPLPSFVEHLDLIRRCGFTPITATHLVDICTGVRPHDGRYIALTFDDGHLSHWLYAAPLLAERRMTATFFVVTDLVGDGPRRTPRDTPPLPDTGEAFRRAVTSGDRTAFVNAAEVAALSGDLGMEIGSHTAAHQACFRSLARIGHVSDRAHWSTWRIYTAPREGQPVCARGSAYAYNGYWPLEADQGPAGFRRRSDEERYAFCLDDLRRSRSSVSALGGGEQQVLCWPWGEFDPIAERACRAAGFSGAFTLEHGVNGRGTDPYRLHRIRVGRRRGRSWLLSHLVLHSRARAASACATRFRKKPDTGRVLYVTDSTKASGGSRQLLNNVAALSGMGIPVTVVAPVPSAVAADLERRGTPVIAWNEPRRLFRFARFLAGVGRAHGIDVVHTFHSRPLKAAVLGTLLGGRYRLFLNRGVIHRPNPLMGLFARVADGVVCNSHAGARVLRAHGTPAGRINVVYNSVVATPAPRRAGSPVRPRVLWVGNDNPVKGFDIFVEAARLVVERWPECPVTFASCGIVAGRAELPGTTGGAVPPIDILGPMPHEAVVAALAESDVFLLTSRSESLPNVLLEAFSQGLPVVCTDVGGVGELVRDGVNGWLCPAGDASRLAERVHDLLADPGRRALMGARNRELAATRLANLRKGHLLLRVYSGDRVIDTIGWDEAGDAISGIDRGW